MQKKNQKKYVIKCKMSVKYYHLDAEHRGSQGSNIYRKFHEKADAHLDLEEGVKQANGKRHSI